MPVSWLSPARATVPLTVAAVALAAVVVAPPAHAAAITPGTTLVVAADAPVTDASGAVWSPDAPYADGGSLSRTTVTVRGTANPGLFAEVRTGASAYHFPVAGRTEVVTLGFVEPDRTARPTQRLFDVTAEGRTVVSSVDLAATAGVLTAYRVSFAVQVSDGVLDLSLTGRDGSVPVVSNVRIVSSGEASPTAGEGAVPVTPWSPEAFGARGDGVADDTAALQKAFDSAPTGQAVVLAAGRTYAHSGVLHLRKRYLHVSGPGTLLATAEATSSVWIEADHVLVDGGIVVRTASTTRRWEAWEQMGLRIVGRTGVTVRSVTVDGSAAAGVYVGNGASNFVLDHVTVQNSRADGIHLTGGANRGLVLAPTVRNSGDDGVAVVSYQQDGTACHDISVASPTILGTTWGRGLSVVGGTRITETDVDVRDSSAAGIYLAAEGDPWFTAAPRQVTISGGSVTGANTDPDVDHGAVVVLSGRSGGIVPAGVTVRDLRISGTRPSASRNLGVITYGDAPSAVLFSDIAIVGGPPSAYSGNTPTSSYRLTRVTHDGVAVPPGG